MCFNIDIKTRGGFLYNRIKNLRIDRDLSQKEMASVLNIAQTTYSDYELGKLNIPIVSLVKLAIFHKTSVDYLLNLTDEKRPYPKSKLI